GTGAVSSSGAATGAASAFSAASTSPVPSSLTCSGMLPLGASSSRAFGVAPRYAGGIVVPGGPQPSSRSQPSSTDTGADRARVDEADLVWAELEPGLEWLSSER